MFSHVTLQGMFLGEGLPTACACQSPFLMCREVGGGAVLGALARDQERFFQNL